MTLPTPAEVRIRERFLELEAEVTALTKRVAILEEDNQDAQTALRWLGVGDAGARRIR